MSALEALSDPLVLRAAWVRIDTWYRTGNLAPQPELSRWRLHPESELRNLADDLQKGRWKPTSWRQVPYPKKGACLRHYALPTVRDQVAFMAFMVLLAPSVDNQVLNFAFGNRWHRSIRWDRMSKDQGRKPSKTKKNPAPGRWKRGAYELLSRKSYLPYSRSHGLFRRAAHWTVARMTTAGIPDKDYGGPIQHPRDYSREFLPPFVRETWWSGTGAGDNRAFWAGLDLQLAYPSVCLKRLRQCFGHVRPIVSPSTKLSGYPGRLRDLLARQEELVTLGDYLVDALEEVSLITDSIPRRSWRPGCARPDLPPKNRGLPTGLAISGILMNLALGPADKKIFSYLRSRRGNERGAVLRFADDMYVLSRSLAGLLGLIDQVWRALADDQKTTLGSGKSDSNFHLNVEKFQPDPLADLVRRYLRDNGWKRCDDCGQLRPPAEAQKNQTLASWWHLSGPHLPKHKTAVQRTAVGPLEVGPFVTTLVARLSELGVDTLGERFGEGARDRLGRLHELARFDIGDQQVRPDTRRSFAANRLVRVWLPADQGAAETALSEIRESVAYVLQASPWKFSLWRPIVRAAALRPPEQASHQGDHLAKEWLAAQLGRIAHAPEADDPRSWIKTWPEDDAHESRFEDVSWRELYLSFHRTAFWLSLADVLRELWRHHDRTSHPHLGDPGPPPDWWTLRAVPEGGHKAVAEFLGSLDHWVAVLYSTAQPQPPLKEWSWELDQIVAATLSSVPRSALADALLRAEPAGDQLVIPHELFSASAPHTLRVLTEAGRVLAGPRDARRLGQSALAHIHLAGQDSGLASFLFPPERAPRVLGTRRNPDHTIAIALSLGCAAYLPFELLEEALRVSATDPKEVHPDRLSLLEYGRARRLILGHEWTGP